MRSSIRGMAKTKAALQRVALEIEAATPAAVDAGGGVIAREMLARIPRDTGRSAAGIRVEVSGDTASVGTDTDYDRFVQQGTRNMSAQPYGEDAAVAAAPGVIGAMLAVYRAAIE